MSLQILDAKDGEKTAFYNNVYLHSSYSPKKEAGRWVDNINLLFEPESIIITEPALAFQLPYLKARFPNCKIAAVRYSHDFDAYNTSFDFVFYAEKEGQLFSSLTRSFSEEKIYSVLFLSWTASEKAFPKENKRAWQEIKQALERAKTLLVTRQCFEKRWLLNSLNLLKYTEHFFEVKKTDLPILIAASGPSLSDCIKEIKKNQEKFFIIALSSAILPLLKNDIKPDICLSSDGGYWAKAHLKSLFENDLPLAIPLEAALPKKLFKSKRIIPLAYSDGPSAELLKALKLDFTKAERNPTVSGSALKLAENITSGKIFFAGLDLAVSRGFNHTQPNELEKNSALTDRLLESKEKRLFKASLPSQSLEIYRDWFCLENAEDRVYRIIGRNRGQTELGKIRDIGPEDFSLIFNKAVQKKDNKKWIEQRKENLPSKKEISLKIRSFIDSYSRSPHWKKSLFPLDMVALNHDRNNPELLEKLEKENLSLLSKIQKILNDD